LLKAAEGPLEFIDTNDFSTMNTITPELTTDVEWDPTGRYVVAAVSIWTGKVADTGFTLTTFQGKLIRRERIERFGNLVWRPRPPGVLSHAQIKQIKKDLKKYTPKFDLEDKILRTEGAREEIERKQKAYDSWKEYRDRKIAQYKSQKHQRMILRNHIDTDELDADRSSMIEETMEVLIREDIKILNE